MYYNSLVFEHKCHSIIILNNNLTGTHSIAHPTQAHLAMQASLTAARAPIMLHVIRCRLAVHTGTAPAPTLALQRTMSASSSPRPSASRAWRAPWRRTEASLTSTHQLQSTGPSSRSVAGPTTQAPTATPPTNGSASLSKLLSLSPLCASAQQHGANFV